MVALSKGKAKVEFFDGKELDGVDVSVVRAEGGAFVEVFGNLALSVLTTAEVRRRKAAWKEIHRMAAVPVGVAFG